MINIRRIAESDAEHFLQLCKTIDSETKFMLFEPGERKITVEEQRNRIKKMLAEKHSTIFLAEIDHRLVGYLAAIRGKNRRNKHRVHIAVGILQQFTGQGIGSKLFSILEEWSKKMVSTVWS